MPLEIIASVYALGSLVRKGSVRFYWNKGSRFFEENVMVVITGGFCLLSGEVNIAVVEGSHCLLVQEKVQ